MNRQRSLVPHGFLFFSALPHEHQAEQRSHDEHADHDEHHVHVEAGGGLIASTAPDFIARTVGSRVFARNVVIRLERHQVLLEGGGITALIGCDFLFESGDVGDQIGNVPLEESVVHVGWFRESLGGHPLDGLTRFVFLAGGVNRSNGQANVVHVAHSVDSGVATVAVGGGDVHLLRPPGAGTGHVKVVLPKAVAGTGQFVAQRPGHRDDVVGGCGVRQRERSGWGLGFVGVGHVDVHVSGAVVGR